MWSFRNLLTRRTSRRCHREAFSAIVQLLETRRVLSAGSLTGWSLTADSGQLPYNWQQPDLQPAAVVQPNPEPIVRKAGSVTGDDAPSERRETSSAAEVLTSAGNLGRNGLRRPRNINTEKTPAPDPGNLSTLADLAWINSSGPASLTGRESLSATLDQLARLDRPAMDQIGVPVFPGHFEFPIVDLPHPDGGLIDVTPLFQPDASAADSALVEIRQERSPTDIDDRPGSYDDTRNSPLQTEPLDDFVPLPSAATVLELPRHRATATSDDGGYIDFGPFASAASFAAKNEASGSQASRGTLPQPEIDGAVGRHRSFQIADNIENAVSDEVAADACDRINTVGSTVPLAAADAVDESAVPLVPEVPTTATVTRGNPNAAAGSGLKTEPAIRSSAHSTTLMKFSARAAGDVTGATDARHITDSPPKTRPVWLVLPALVTVGALRSGVRQRLRKIVAGLARKF